jgi:Domain of Unknown Function (DUF1080)
LAQEVVIMKVLVAMSACGLMLTATSGAEAAEYCAAEVHTVTPGDLVATALSAPSDAIVLFDGHDLTQWQGKNGPAAWEVHDGVLTVKKGSGDIETRQSFHDIQLHIEWRIPSDISGEGQLRGNSGIFLQGRYELQVLDSYRNPTYPDGQAGAIYGQSAPLVNAMRKPGEWNIFDVIYTAPRFNEDGRVYAGARVTVLLNGVLIQNNTEIYGNTGPWGKPGYYEADAVGPVRLQDHPDPSKPISYRNIWVRELGAASTGAVLKQQPNADLLVASTASLGELLADPDSRDVLSRCLPDVVPSLGTSKTMNRMTLLQLKEYVVSLSDAKLRAIDSELARVRARQPAK